LSYVAIPDPEGVRERPRLYALRVWTFSARINKRAVTGLAVLHPPGIGSGTTIPIMPHQSSADVSRQVPRRATAPRGEGSLVRFAMTSTDWPQLSAVRNRTISLGTQLAANTTQEVDEGGRYNAPAAHEMHGESAVLAQLPDRSRQDEEQRRGGQEEPKPPGGDIPPNAAHTRTLGDQGSFWCRNPTIGARRLCGAKPCPRPHPSAPSTHVLDGRVRL